MTDLLIRNVPATTLELLKARAQARGRSLQAEALETLVSHVKPSGAELVEWLETVRPKHLSAEQAAEIVEFATEAIRRDRDER
jgi:plasmid stability protein